MTGTTIVLFILICIASFFFGLLIGYRDSYQTLLDTLTNLEDLELVENSEDYNEEEERRL